MANDSFNVLVVDGSEITRNSLSRRLRDEGFNCESVVSGKEALGLLRAKSFDLVLLDTMTSDMNGYQVLETIKFDRQLSDIAVIMVSAIDDLDNVMRCTELGADDYLTKPFDPVLLRTAIARSLKNIPSSIPVKPKATILQLEIPKKTPKKEILPTPDMSLQDAVNQIINTGQISRKGYIHFSKAIFNGLFSRTSLTAIEYGQINAIFTYLQSGRIKVMD